MPACSKPLLSSRIFKFRAWDNENKKFALYGFNIIGECTLFDIANQFVVGIIRVNQLLF